VKDNEYGYGNNAKTNEAGREMLNPRTKTVGNVGNECDDYQRQEPSAKHDQNFCWKRRLRVVQRAADGERRANTDIESWVDHRCAKLDLPAAEAWRNGQIGGRPLRVGHYVRNINFTTVGCATEKDAIADDFARKAVMRNSQVGRWIEWVGKECIRRTWDSGK
jgi:hypothetical protein